MSEFIVEFGQLNAAKEAAFVQAVDNFAKWRVASAKPGIEVHDEPALMVKTVCSIDGSLNKAIRFEDKVWAVTFMRFWHRELSALENAN